MYRINLYPEREANRRDLRRRVRRTAALTAILGLQGLWVCGLVVSGLILREQARNLRATIDRQQVQVHASRLTGEQYELARRLLQERLGRIDWSPKLAAVAQAMPAALQLQRIDALCVRRGSQPILQLAGISREPVGGGSALDRLADSLRAEPRIAGELPHIAIQTVESEEAHSFVLGCEGSRQTP